MASLSMFVCILLFVDEFASFVESEEIEVEPELEPGHAKHDYDSVEEVKGHETTSEKITENAFGLGEAILDVAYYLRRFKFNGYDPRPRSSRERHFFAEFPYPPLNNIHWEVKKNCESSFPECVEYLRDKVSQALLPRQLDSASVIRQNGWSFPQDEKSIEAANEDCLKLLEADENAFDVQKFRWLTSASYYMCLYAMKETSFLEVFNEDCDDFSSCLGANNGDFRANNSKSFACALYSFCPDPCCPLKHSRNPSDCFDVGPCFSSSATNRNCELIKKNNVRMESLVLNRWNVSCNCDRIGMRWDSKSGMCVDIDECLELPDSACDSPSETCQNLRGSYKCICNPLGYRRNPETNACERDSILQSILHRSGVTRDREIPLFHRKIANVMSELATFLAGRRTESNVTSDS